jgi:hypothetical protein
VEQHPSLDVVDEFAAFKKLPTLDSTDKMLDLLDWWLQDVGPQSTPDLAAEKKRMLNGLRTLWKQKLRDWEANFQTSNGRKPEREDKKAIREWYVAFKRASDALGM